MSSGRIEPAHIARSEHERETVYRLRYDVYTRELRKGFLTTVDHERGWIKDPEDELDDVSIFYTGTPEVATGALRLQMFKPGEVPTAVQDRFSMRIFPGIERIPTCEAARLIVRPAFRGGRILSALACTAFEYAAAQEIEVCFVYCSPGLVPAYMRLGFRPYPGHVIPNEDGIRLPMLLVASDIEHLRSVRSPLTDLMARRFDSSRSAPEVHALIEICKANEAHYQTEPERVWETVREHLNPGPDTHSRALDGLSPEDVRTLCQCGFIIDIPADKVVMREGLVERELYLVLSGSYLVTMDEKELGVLSNGDVLGEISFFQSPGERVATIRSLTPGKAMVLERNFVERLIETHPELACRVLFNLGRIVSAHLSMALHAYTDE